MTHHCITMQFATVNSKTVEDEVPSKRVWQWQPISFSKKTTFIFSAGPAASVSACSFCCPVHCPLHNLQLINYWAHWYLFLIRIIGRFLLFLLSSLAFVIALFSPTLLMEVRFHPKIRCKHKKRCAKITVEQW